MLLHSSGEPASFTAQRLVSHESWCFMRCIRRDLSNCTSSSGLKPYPLYSLNKLKPAWCGLAGHYIKSPLLHRCHSGYRRCSASNACKHNVVIPALVNSCSPPFSLCYVCPFSVYLQIRVSLFSRKNSKSSQHCVTLCWKLIYYFKLKLQFFYKTQSPFCWSSCLTVTWGYYYQVNFSSNILGKHILCLYT